jgi:hypothetical protein
MSIKTRIEKLESVAEENEPSNLVPLTIPWPDEWGGPKEYMVTPEYIAALVKIYGKHSEQTNPTT